MIFFDLEDCLWRRRRIKEQRTGQDHINVLELGSMTKNVLRCLLVSVENGLSEVRFR